MLCVVVLIDIVDVDKVEQTLLELLVVLVLGLAPLNLAKGCHTGELHILYACKVGYILGPEVGLYAYDVLLLLGSE